jgi:hypothetical protein
MNIIYSDLSTKRIFALHNIVPTKVRPKRPGWNNLILTCIVGVCFILLSLSASWINYLHNIHFNSGNVFPKEFDNWEAKVVLEIVSILVTV